MISPIVPLTYRGTPIVQFHVSSLTKEPDSATFIAAGGVGLANSISGASVYYSGGGGGGVYPGGSGGAGGNGGGGAGAGNGGTATAGTANTGGGGGGAGYAYLL